MDRPAAASSPVRPQRLGTLVEVLRWRARTQPRDVAFTFLIDGEQEEQNLTYEELDRRARAIAAELRRRGAVGERALLVFDAGLDYVAALYGCLYAGVVAVPVYPPDPFRIDRTLPRLQAIVADAGASWLLATQATLDWAGSLFRSVPGLQFSAATDVLAQTSPPARCELPRGGSRPALLQYTSGSTGTPRGVIIPHRSLLANLKRIELALDRDGVIAVSWLPAYHDMGLIGGIFQPVYSGRRVIMLSPVSFMQRPLRWLKAISNYRAWTTAAPNFAYDLCVRKITADERATLDLSSLRVAINGAERVRAETIDRFCETFAECGFRREAFYPCYGMAEATLMVAGGDVDAAPVVRTFQAAALEHGRAVAASETETHGRRLVGCGRSLPGQRIAIVDPRSGRRCRKNRVGEIWVSGPSIGQGYWNRAEESQATFAARLGEWDEGPYLRTGDVGFIHDGELFVTGRIKELIILWGKNYYPQDIEHTVAAAYPGLKLDGGAAFSIEAGGQERLVVVQEAARPKRIDAEQVIDTIRRRVAEEHDLPVYAAALIPVGALPKTSSGKTQRGACREMYLAGTLPMIAHWRNECLSDPSGDARADEPTAPRDPTQSRLAELWAEVLGVEWPGIDTSFFDLGGQSLVATQLLARVRAAFEVDLPLHVLFESPTIARLAARIDEARRKGTSCAIEPLRRTDRNGPMPLSFAQERFWLLEQLEATPRYNVPARIRLSGRLNLPALERSLDEIVRRHEALRTTFRVVGGRPAPIIAPDGKIPLTVVDAEPAGVDAAAQQEAFDLERGPLVRAMLVRHSDEEHRLLLTAHHIACDGWSMGVFLRELAALYEAQVRDQPSHLGALPIQYADYAAWQRAEPTAQLLDRQLTYWKDRFQEPPPPLALLTDRPRGGGKRFRPGRHARALPVELVAALDQFSRREGATMYMTLLAAFGAWLARYTGQSDICIGSPAAGRTRAELEGLIGCFINTLPLRLDLTGEPTFRELLARVRNETLGALVHQDVPLEKIVDAVQPSRVANHASLFQTMFVLENVPWSPWQAGDVTIGDVQVDHAALATFDLTLVVEQQDGALRATLVYDAELFDGDVMRRMLSAWETMLTGIVADADRPVTRLPMMSEEERRQVLIEWSGAETVDRSAGFVELFEAQAHQSPASVAVTCGASRLSYGQLNERANRLAHYLRELGVGPDSLVAICIERSCEMFVGLLGTAKAGGAYVPLDPDYPLERLEWMLDDARPSVLLTRKHLARRLPRHSARVVCLDDDRAVIDRQSSDNPAPLAGFEDLAYVIYTSGSTGKPKGVMVSRRNLSNLAVVLRESVRAESGDRVLQFASLSFDASVWEMTMALSVGATLCVPGPEALLPGPQMVDWLRKQRITIATLTPSVLSALPDAELPELHTIIAGGEECGVEIVNRWARGRRFLNGYGPTENTVCTTLAECVPGMSRLPIGRPLANIYVYVVDPRGEPAAVGVPGELCVGGAGLAVGYLHRPELTAERFVRNPFVGDPKARMYRTGDLVRWRGDGQLEFLGRLDDQVKIRGFRIEPGEIESALREHPAVRDAVVMARTEEGSEKKRLVAYIVPADANTSLVRELRQHLERRLPCHMVPASYVALDSLPRLPGGKIDRRALPAPDVFQRACSRPFVAPRTPTEQALARIWGEVLGLPGVGAHDNFFELGGDSIQTIQIVTRARQAGLRFTPRQLFQYQTIAQLAEVEGTGDERPNDRAAPTGPVPLLPIQHWFFRHVTVDPEHFNQAVLLEVTAPIDAELVQAALGYVSGRHDALRLRFERGSDGWQQRLAGPESAAWPLDRFDFSPLGATDQEAAFRAAAGRLQAGLNLADGPVSRAGWFDFGLGRKRRLLLVVHHLAVDAVSWRVLLEDLHAACEAMERGQPPVSAPATTSVAVWAERLAECARRPELLEEVDYWLSATDCAVVALPRDRADGDNLRADARMVPAVLDETQTSRLLAEVPSRYGAETGDVLLAALGQTLSSWTQSAPTLIDVEGHGRHPFIDEVDLSRTVGWCTTIHPVRLDVQANDSPAAAVRWAERQRRRAPNRGLGYGLLRYLRADQIVSAKLDSRPHAEISFNYLGRFDGLLPRDRKFTLLHGASGPAQSPRQQRTYLIEINAYVLEGRLHVEWNFGEKIHRRDTIERLAKAFSERLRAYVADGRGAMHGGSTSSDAPVSEVEDQYPLTSMQRLMLIHSLRAPESEVLREQVSATLSGPLDERRLYRAWQEVVGRHAALRTEFRWRGLIEPFQVVRRQIELPWTSEDWRGAGPDEQAQRLADRRAAERRLVFDPQRAPLMRWSSIRLADEKWYFSWQAHHLLFDGWSLSLILGEVLAAYEGGGRDSYAPPQFGEYVARLGRKGPNAARSFWKRVLAGADLPTPLPLSSAAAPRAPGDAGSILVRCDLTGEATSELAAFARRQQTTLGAVLAGAWALLLACYSGRDDVLFGMAFSGRPADLPGVEAMVGPLFKNLPLRVRLEDSESVGDWLRRIQRSLSDLEPFQDSSLADIHEWGHRTAGGRLFDSLLAVENYPLETVLRDKFGDLAVSDVQVTAQSGYRLTLVAVPGRELSLRLSCDERCFAPGAAGRLLAELQDAIESIVSGEPQNVDELLDRFTESPLAAASTMLATGEKRAEPSATHPFVAPRDELEAQLARIWADVLHREPIGVCDNFFDLGGDSMLAVRLMAAIELECDRRLSLGWLFQSPTIEHLAAALRTSDQTGSFSPLISLRAGGSKTPLFCVHPAGGTVFCYRELAKHLDPARPIYALEARGIDGRQPPHTRLADMAADYVAAIREVQPQGPYLLAGWSLGGIIAYEMARRIVEQGGEVGLLNVIDAGMVSADERFREDDFLPMLLALFPHEHRPSLEEVRGLGAAEQLAFFHRRAQQAQVLAGPDAAAMIQHVFRVFQANLNALVEYLPQPYSGRITLFRASDNATPLHADPLLGWGRWAQAGVDVRHLEGEHVNLFSEPHVRGVAEQLQECLQHVVGIDK